MGIDRKQGHGSQDELYLNLTSAISRNQDLEVLARIRAATRRCFASQAAKQKMQSFTIGTLEVFPTRLRAQRGNAVVDLSLRDVGILRLLRQYKGEAVGRDRFFNECWCLDHMPNSRKLDQPISKLRKRI